MSAVVLPTALDARLPANYERACQALAECSRADECQDWADKAAALASYAKQADDESLHHYADRIKARAIRRGGELLKQVEPAKNQYDASARVGALPSTRTAAAESAGLSEHQRKTMLRVASVPEGDFERQVESENPPTITALAEQGKKSAHLGTSSPHEFRIATQALASLRRFAEFARATDAATAARGVQQKEITTARNHVAELDAWLDRFVVSLGGSRK